VRALLGGHAGWIVVEQSNHSLSEVIKLCKWIDILVSSERSTKEISKECVQIALKGIVEIG